MGLLAAAFPALAGVAGAASTFATIGSVASVLGGVVGAAGSLESGAAQSAAATYQAQLAASNEKIAQQNATQAEATGSAQVEQEGIKTKAEVGAIKAAQAASNIDVNSGSALDVRSSAAALGQLDALTIRSNAEKTAYGYETQASQFAGQESLEQATAQQAQLAGGIGAFSSILGAASGVSNQYSRWAQAAGGGGSVIGDSGAGTGANFVGGEANLALFP